jgi:hypothetical protein
MKVVYKYAVSPHNGKAVELPRPAKIVKVGMQGDTLMLWAEHGVPDANTSHVTRHFDVFGTGHPIPEDAVHVGTFFDGPFVWHVYETMETS